MISPEKMLEVAFLLHRRGQQSEAERVCRRVLEQHPDAVEARLLLGIVSAHQGHLDEAVAQFQQVITQRPNEAGAFSNLGNVYRARDQFDAAIAAYRRAVHLNPNLPDVHYNLGLLLHRLGDLGTAIHHYQRSIALAPQFAAAHNALGIALRQAGRIEEAIAAHKMAITHDPKLAEGWDSLGNALREAGQMEDAIRCHQTALDLKPDLAIAQYNLGLTLLDEQLPDLAIPCFDQAVTRLPDYRPARLARATARLLAGDLQAGFAEYEARLEESNLEVMGGDRPLWDGSPLNGQTILLLAEQGLGDTLQFVRYAQQVVDLGGTVILSCRRPLVRLLKTMPALSQVVERDGELPPCDTYAPLMSLPHLLNTTLETIPASVPYLDIARLEPVPLPFPPIPAGANRPPYRIGLSWAANDPYPSAYPSRRRSCPLLAMQRLFASSDLQFYQFYGLQVGESRQDIDRYGLQDTVIDCSDRLQDLADTATLMHHLDLVITVDTAIAHLAGALGKPVWVLLPYACDWRWLIDRHDSPWYPTMRLFRQRYPGDWATVIEQVKASLDGADLLR